MASPSRPLSLLDDKASKMGTYYFVPSSAKNALIIVLGEFCGTFMFLLLSFIGAQTAITTNSPVANTPLLPFSLLYIASSFGTALAVNVWIFYRVSGGMFNPAVTLGLTLIGAVTPIRALMIVPAQMAASIAAAAVVLGLLPGDLRVANALSDQTNVVQGLFLEMFLTAQLVLTVYFLAVEKHRATFLAPIGIGVSVFVAHMAGTNYTGTSINPARSFGPAVITGFVDYHWIYWLGPAMGSLLAYAIYMLLKLLDYKTANPGQDSDDLEIACGGGLPPLTSGPRNMYTHDGLRTSIDHLTMKDGRTLDLRRDNIRQLGHHPLGSTPYLNVRFSWNKE